MDDNIESEIISIFASGNGLTIRSARTPIDAEPEVTYLTIPLKHLDSFLDVMHSIAVYRGLCSTPTKMHEVPFSKN